MIIRAGYSVRFECPQPTPTLLMLNIHPSRQPDLLEPEVIAFSPQVETSRYTDTFGNACMRLVAPAGPLEISTMFTISDPGTTDIIPYDARQHDIADLPDDTLLYLLGSRYCETDVLSERAWQIFQGTTPGWSRVQAILDYVHNHIRFDYMQADRMRSAHGALLQAVGVCRDYTHLAIAFCRCMNIPARYCTGYLGDIGVPVSASPMDFSAWFEVFLGGEWHTADARNNIPRIGRILMARGRDATDVALSTQFGPTILSGFTVTTDMVSA